MLDEMSDNQCKCQLYTFLYYLGDRKICEQVLGFTDVSCDRTSGGLYKHIVQQVINRWS
jgi:hypothetical protein